MNLRQRSRRKPIIVSCLLALMALAPAAAQSAPATADGIQLYKQAKYSQAAQALNASIKASKTANPTLYYYLGCCYYQPNQRDSAKDIYRYIRNNFPLSQEAKMAGGMLAQLDTTPTASTTVAARPAAASNSSTSRPTTEERSSQDLAEATKLLEALKQRGERGHRSTPEDLAGLPDTGKFNFKRSEHGHMDVTVMINGRPMPCWFDTGAGALFGMDQLREAGVDVSKAKDAGYTHGWAGVPVKIWSMPAKVKLGNITRDIEIVLEENPNLTPLIGQDFVDGYQYEIDDKAGVVTMNKTFSGDKQAVNSMYDVPCQIKHGDDVFQLEINGKKAEAFIDTGASATIMNGATAQALGIQIPDDAEHLRMSGVGGDFGVVAVYLDLRVGPIHRPDFKVLVGGNAGNCVGQDFMEGWRFKVDRQKNLLRFFH
jgi:predicted aspartyl protease